MPDPTRPRSKTMPLSASAPVSTGTSQAKAFHTEGSATAPVQRKTTEQPALNRQQTRSRSGSFFSKLFSSSSSAPQPPTDGDPPVSCPTSRRQKQTDTAGQPRQRSQSQAAARTTSWALWSSKTSDGDISADDEEVHRLLNGAPYL